MEIIITAEKLQKIYTTDAEKIAALKGIDMTVNRGEFVAIMGPSGAGKTTLLNLIGCLDSPSLGTLCVAGYNVGQVHQRKLPVIRREIVGFVFQEFFILPSLTATENVGLPAVFNKKRKKNDIHSRAVELLHKVGLNHRLNHFPSELSGGEMQRVAIARALMNSPEIICADEPTGNLDTKNARNIFSLMREITRTQGVTVLCATHNYRLGQMADRIVYLNNGTIDTIEKGTVKQ